jgi:hypothetical protein
MSLNNALLIFLSFLFFLSCTPKNSPEALAQKFCGCSEEISKASVKLREKIINQKEFEKIRNEHILCMGPDDPRQNLNQDELSKFDTEFIKAIFKKCPGIARNYGYKE